MGKEEPF